MITVTRTRQSSVATNQPAAKVGLSLTKRESTGKVLIHRVHDNSLFSGSGIQAGEELVSVNGVSVKGLPTVQHVVKLLQRQATVTLVVTGSSCTTAYDDIDACEMGQFLVNPCWFLYLKLKARQERNKMDNNEHAPREDPRVAKTLWISNLQQILYLASFYTVWWIAFARVIPLNQARHHLSTFHDIFPCALFVLSVLSWIAAKIARPGTITSQTMTKFDNYRYDGILYQPDICPTLNIRKLARSKFDRYSQQHVPRFDHFCGWLGNTIGEENYRFFMAFLGIHVVMVVYGFASTAYMLYREAVALSSEASPIFDVAFLRHPSIAAVCLFTLLASIPTTMFFWFHLSLIRSGMTTNEFYKWKQIRKENTKDAPTKTVHCVSTDLETASSSSSTSSRKGQQFYNLGFIGNLHEVFFPRSLRMSVPMGHKES